MATNLTTTAFLEKYRDDFKDSNHYHRILFNSGEVLQARELTQMQTIIQKEIERFGSNIFIEGASVLGGGAMCDNKYEFIKLDTTTNALPANPNQMVGVTITGATSGIVAKVLEVVTATGSDPDTLYIEYTNKTTGTAAAQAPVRFTAGENLTNAVTLLTVQTTDTAANPAKGRGTKVSTATGIFFTQGHFVQADPQTIIVSKYTSDPTVRVGFRVKQQIFTVDDDQALYDNQGKLPNFTAPGADRYRITMELATEANVDSDEIFVFYTRLERGRIVETVSSDNSYNKIEDHAATRIREINGNFIKKHVTIRFEEHPTDSTKFKAKVSPGILYLNGYRQEYFGTTEFDVNKALTTELVENDLISVGIGNYILTDSSLGVPNISEFEQYNIKDGYKNTGSTIGTCRVKSIEEDGANIRYYLMDIQMNSGQDFRDARSIAVDNLNYANPILENGEATLKNTSANIMIFPFQHSRVQGIADVSYAVVLRDTRTTDGSGNVSMPTLSGGDLYSDTTDWIIARTDTGALITPSITLTGGGTGADISGAPTSTNLEIIYKKTISAATARTKTVTNTTVTTTVTTPASGAPYISLGKADIIDVTRVRITDSDGLDVKARFVLDNGQRDNFYDVGRLVLKGNQTAPTGNVFVRFNYYAHGASGDFFAPTSYPAPYKDIPDYFDKTGTKYDLRSSLDFRSRKDDTGANFSAATARYNGLPTNSSVINLDTTYYLPRSDKLISLNPLKYIEGDPSFAPQFPQIPTGSLELYDISLNAGSIHESDMSTFKHEAKGFTMKEIARLENRVERLEEYTTLSLLEADTKTFAVLDSGGIDRTKSGFLVDNFVDHFSSKTDDVEFKSSINPQQKFMRPSFTEEAVKLIYDSNASTNTILKGDNIYLKYRHVSYLNQNIASTTENVNPFAVITNKGQIKFSPSSDFWAEKKVRNETVVQGGTRLDTRSQANFGNWNWNWGGVRVGQQIGPSGRTIRRDVFTFTNFGTSGNESSGQRRRNVEVGRVVNRVVSEQTIREVIDERIVDIALIPFMRSLRVYFEVYGLAPNTRHYPFFDGVDVSDWVDGTATFQNSASDGDVVGNRFNRATVHPDAPNAADRVLTTNSVGYLQGSFFIPNTANIRFRTGTKLFELMDVTGGDAQWAMSSGSADFTSNGQIQTVDRTVRSTREISIRGVFQRDRFITWQEMEPRDDSGSDPLAQSFFVTRPDGIYVTQVKVFFKTKDAAKPIECQLRPVTAGVPATFLVPGASKFLNPSSVNTSNDGTVATIFEFDEPIYLTGGEEFAVVLKSDSNDYNVFIAETGEYEVGSTSRKVAKQPTNGSLFLSQNASTWTPKQNADLKFEIMKASWIGTTGTAILENAALPADLLPIDAFSVDSAGSTVNVYQPSHGFIAGDIVRFTGFDSALTYGGFGGDSMNDNYTITKVDEDNYQISMDSLNPTIFGGSTGLATQNILFEIMHPRLQIMTPGTSDITLDYKLTNGKSLAGNETQYDIDNTFTRGIINDDIYFNVPKIIANSEREANTAMAGNKSATIRLNLTAQDSDVAPMIDMQRAGMWLIHNQIDFQDSAGSLGVTVNLDRNNPIKYAAETDPTGGSHIAKHVVKPLILENPAVGAKIILSANRPSVADFDVYYKAIQQDEAFDDFDWTYIAAEEVIQSDENPDVFRDYSYLIGGTSGFSTSFDKVLVKIVMKSRNAALVPVFKDLRIIALAV